MKPYALQNLLEIETMCVIQHDGWPCNSCFHTLGNHLIDLKEDIHEYWLAVLGYRGDYPDLKGYKPELLLELIKVLET